MSKVKMDQQVAYDTITNQRVRLMGEAYQGFYILIGRDWVYRSEYQLRSIV
jgi:hypothetical protein